MLPGKQIVFKQPHLLEAICLSFANGIVERTREAMPQYEAAGFDVRRRAGRNRERRSIRDRGL